MNKPSANDQPKQVGSLLGSSVTVGSMTMLSRVMGLIRDIVIARFFGAGGNADAFFIAFKVPQFLRRLFAEGAFSQAFVPVLSEYRRQYENEGNLAAIQVLVNAVCGVLGGSLLLLTGLVVMAAPMVAMLFAPGFIDQPEKFALTAGLLRITFPYLLLISLTGFAGAILNSYDRFVVPAFTPVLLNLSLIGFAVFVSPLLAQPVYALAWAVLFAGCAQLLFQLPFLARLELLPQPIWDTQHPGVRKIMALMLPAIFGVSVSQINLLLDTVLASFLPTGSVSWLYYSDRLAELPLGVFGIAIATVILPSLSRLGLKRDEVDDAGGEGSVTANKSPEIKFQQTLDWALRCIVVIALPASAALIILASPILYTLFQYQAMTPEDVHMASYSLRAYALGLLAFMAIKVLATGYYSQQDTKTPVKIGIITMGLNMVLNLIFVGFLHFYFKLGHVGLALATSVSAFVNAGMLLRGLSAVQVKSASEMQVSEQGSTLDRDEVKNGPILSSQFWRLLQKVIVAVCAMLVLLQFLLPDPLFWPDANSWQRIVKVTWLCFAGLVTYLSLLFALGVRFKQFRAVSVD